MNMRDELHGKLIVGPFSVPANDVLHEMDARGLWMNETGEDPDIIHGGDGLRLRASGPEVWAYFIGEDGREADQSLVDLFWLATTAPQTSFIMAGSHMLSPTESVITSARGHHDGKRVCWEEKRLYRSPTLIHDLAALAPALDEDFAP